MSKKTETLHDCPHCNGKGYTARGFAAHMAQRHKGMVVVKTEPEKPELMKEFEPARRHVENIREAGRRASHESILLGHELNRLKLELGVKAGRPKQLPQSAVIKPWATLVEEQTGLSIDTCDRCMQLAAGAKKHIPILMAGDVLKTPFSALPESRQTEVSKALEKAADGRSMAQMMLDFGVWKEKKSKAPPPGGKSAKNDFKGGASNRVGELDPELMRQTALENGNALRDMIDGDSWRHLLDDELNAWHAMLERAAKAAEEVIKTRQAAELKAGRGKR